MKHRTKIMVLMTVFAAVGVGIVHSSSENPRTPVEFFTGHSHDGKKTIGAPELSGGLDRYGCHNGSVPYHCHR